MSLSSETNRISYVGNGAVDTYSYTFKIFDQDDLLVTVRNTSDVETTLTITTDYTVTGVGEDAGGTIVLVNSSQAWLDGGGDLLTNYVLSIRRVTDIVQSTDIRNQGDFYPEAHENAFDKFVMIDQQQQDELDRSVKLPETISGADFDTILPADISDSASATKVLIVNATYDGFSLGATSDEIANAQSYATAASASASAASASESSASSSASAASASATAAQAAVDAVMFQDVVFKTFADSPITITNADTGKLFSVDCTGGAVAFTLPAIAGLTLTNPWSIGIKKSDSSGNSITVTRSSTDVIDGNTSKTLTVAGSGAVFIPDTDPAPDYWSTTEFGAQAGNITVDNFNGDASTVAFTLSGSPASENNTWVSVDGVLQHKNTYSVSGTTLTFSSAPPTGTNNIEVASGTTLSIGTPSDSTVTRAKCATGGFGSLNVASKTANYTVTSSDDLILCDSSGGAFTLTLPTAVGITGRQYKFKKTDSTFATANAITIDGSGAETIDGSANTTLNTQYEEVTIVSDGTNWQIVDRRIPSVTTDYTMTIGGTTTAPTKATTKEVDKATWRRAGDSAHISFNYHAASAVGAAAGSGVYLFPLPTGLTADTNKVSVGTTILTSSCLVGHGFETDETAAVRITGAVVMLMYDSSNMFMYEPMSITDTGTPAMTQIGSVGSSNHAMNRDKIGFRFTAIIPITGWSS